VSLPVRVLVVNDQDLVRGGLVAILGTADFIDVVGQASDGRAAVRQTIEVDPDVVLMDIEMPGGDGLTATRQIVARCPRTKVLVLTTFDLDDYLYEALRAGASGFLLKTTAPARLAASVKACAEGETLLSPSMTRRLIETYVNRPPARAEPAVCPELAMLTSRELDVLVAVASGKSNAEVGAQLFLGEATVKTHVSHILGKLGLRDRVQAVVLAYEIGLVVPNSE
jgi:DNA-binding NarL/FixJ family response regulator